MTNKEQSYYAITGKHQRPPPLSRQMDRLNRRPRRRTPRRLQTTMMIATTDRKAADRLNREAFKRDAEEITGGHRRTLPLTTGAADRHHVAPSKKRRCAEEEEHLAKESSARGCHQNCNQCHNNLQEATFCVLQSGVFKKITTQCAATARSKDLKFSPGVRRKTKRAATTPSGRERRPRTAPPWSGKTPDKSFP